MHQRLSIPCQATAIMAQMQANSQLGPLHTILALPTRCNPPGCSPQDSLPKYLTDAPLFAILWRLPDVSLGVVSTQVFAPSRVNLSEGGKLMSTKHARGQFSLRLGIAGLAFVAVAVGSANIAFAQDPGTPVNGTPEFTMTFDENGNATINGQPSPAFLLGGPTGGGVLYILPGPIAPGFVNVFSPGDISPTNPNGFSDLLVFQQGGPTGGDLIYFSLLDDNSPPDAADSAGTGPGGGPFAVTEMGPEGSNGFGWIPSNTHTVYQGISDIPEPSTFILGGLGLIALFLIGRRRGALKKI